MPDSTYELEIRDTDKHYLPDEDASYPAWNVKITKYIFMRIENDHDEDMVATLRGTIEDDEDMTNATPGVLTNEITIVPGGVRYFKSSDKWQRMDLELECPVTPSAGSVKVHVRRGD